MIRVCSFIVLLLFTINIDYKPETIPAVDREQLECLAANIYHEARGEDVTGMKAVANVTLNRLSSPGFPDTICKVVYQPRQFSWTASVATVRDTEAYRQAVSIAGFMLSAPKSDITNGSLFFHATSIRKPRWTKQLEQSIIINNHIFYKEK